MLSWFIGVIKIVSNSSHPRSVEASGLCIIFHFLFSFCSSFVDISLNQNFKGIAWCSRSPRMHGWIVTVTVFHRSDCRYLQDWLPSKRIFNSFIFNDINLFSTSEYSYIESHLKLLRSYELNQVYLF